MKALWRTCTWIWRWLVAAWLVWLLPAAAWAHPEPGERPVLTIGVLAIQSAPVEQARWGAVEQALAEALPHYRVQWEFLPYPALDRAISAQHLDAVITNPGHALALQYLVGATPVASVIRQVGGQPLAALAGVAWVRADGPVHQWADLKGRRVAYVSEESLGGRWLQSYELYRRGIDLDAIQWLAAGPSHDGVIDAVLSGKADAAFVRAGVWETRLARGAGDSRALRPLEPQHLPGYPFAASTPLYPDWVVLTLPATSGPVQRDLAAALLAITLSESLRATLPDDAVIGFAPPQSSAAIARVLRTFRVRPFAVPPLTVRERLEAAAWPLAAAGAGLLLVSLVAILLWRQKRRLRQLLQEQAIQARLFDSELGVMIVDAERRILRVNPAFTRITGYHPDEVIGKTPKLLQSGRQDDAFYQSMWDALATKGVWQGEIWNRRKNGEVYPEWLTISAVHGPDGQVRHYVGVFSDLSWRKAAEAQIERLSFQDPLTDLPNRQMLLQRLQAMRVESHEQQTYGALLLIDLDHFHLVNDVYGPRSGDEVLRRCAQRLRDDLQPDDLVARVTSDEFVVLLPARHASSHLAAFAAQAVAERLRSVLREPITLSQGGTVQLTVSIGIAVVGVGGQDRDATDWLKAADLAMQQAKNAGRDVVHFFDPAIEQALAKGFALRQALAQAIDNDELRLYAQPQLDADRRLVGAEVLLRWQRRDGTLVSPAEFIPLAEESGLIVPIGRWVRQQAIATLQRWQARPALAGLRLSVNISAREFAKPDFVELLLQDVAPLQTLARQLELEVTESLFLHNPAAAKAAFMQLKEAGLTLALDDFGTGYSSLSYLQTLPFDVLKIDQRFVAQLGPQDTKSEALVATIIALGRNFGMTVLAEGVETEEQASKLIALGCQQLQGYLLGRPMPLDAFETWATQRQVHPDDTVTTR
ncbi:MAG: EAL domain-containing protein [Thermomonas hydrothermalis]|uniref:EAL domain-containing protein n=1 Tax=Thermomonas hydrothermalis TaxID=213588 RepID=UPI002352BD1F|nr:EAL domain-containing protein [Thermomonas hydrothermalis]MCL6619063.1 EAL domain-containing protein [Thermomonas hydrothermalis]